ncbi:MAG: heme biosynthesis protein HemY [Rhodomicrobium sp.]|nr:MAG: heme biosynthesis protein HemY [Rhodomicrobium sp.]
MTDQQTTTTPETNTDALPVGLTESAAKRIVTIISDEPEGTMLRVSVEGGGCSGFSYKFDLTTEKKADDLVIERSGATVLVDELSLGFLDGSEIDYVDALIGASFQINNPNATASCGCGTSFSI